MNIEEFRTYCLKKPGTTEELPFDNETLVFKVSGKIFALTSIDNFKAINLKCDPEEAISLREKFEEVKEGYHMSKKHWNTISVNGGIPDNKIFEWVDDSYNLVVKGLSKKEKEALNNTSL